MLHPKILFTSGISSSIPYTRGGQNNGNTKKLRNKISVGYIERVLEQ
jgi:hypothetical protein